MADGSPSQASAHVGGTPRARRRIVPRRGWSALRLRELWQYRELTYFLTWRDILIRYKQAVLGVAWAVLNPFVTMVVFTVVLGKLLGLTSGSDVPYGLFVFTGLLPWNLFSQSLGRAGTSLVANANLISKIYFPRLVVPISAVLGGLVDFVIAFVVLLGLMAYYHYPPTWAMLWIPALTLLCIVATLSVSFWLSALNVMYRDVQYIVPFIVQLGLFISPVVYSTKKVPTGTWQVIYGLNPMAGVIQGFRWAILGGSPPSKLLAASVAIVLVLFVSGLFYFKRMERGFADVV